MLNRALKGSVPDTGCLSRALKSWKRSPVSPYGGASQEDRKVKMHSLEKAFRGSENCREASVAGEEEEELMVLVRSWEQACHRGFATFNKLLGFFFFFEWEKKSHWLLWAERRHNLTCIFKRWLGARDEWGGSKQQNIYYSPSQFPREATEAWNPLQVTRWKVLELQPWKWMK